MNLVLLIVTILVALIVVRIGAILFQLTGLEWSLAKFQALSCFTATGFTTKEAELITGNPQRRRVASVLMVLGHAGLVTMIATFANSLNPTIVVHHFSFPLLLTGIPSGVLPWVNLTIIGVSLYAIYKIFTNTKFAIRLTDALKRQIVKQQIIAPVSFEELVMVTGGYEVSRFDISEGSPIVNRALRESGLRDLDIFVLAIERGETAIPNPSADTKILLDYMFREVREYQGGTVWKDRGSRR